jgi:hypothetical protein
MHYNSEIVQHFATSALSHVSGKIWTRAPHLVWRDNLSISSKVRMTGSKKAIDLGEISNAQSCYAWCFYHNHSTTIKGPCSNLSL